jgi:hypothetical protein
LTRGKINKLLKKHHQVLENQNDVFDQGKKLLFHQTRSTARVLEKIKMMTLDLSEKPKHSEN